MLVLSRRTDESIVLTVSGAGGEQITVTVLAVEGDRVKLGIQAPRDVTVLRQELCDAVRQQNLAAAQASAPPPHTLAALNRLLAGVAPPPVDPPVAPPAEPDAPLAP
jgi:carbon storage regulator